MIRKTLSLCSLVLFVASSEGTSFKPGGFLLDTQATRNDKLPPSLLETEIRNQTLSDQSDQKCHIHDSNMTTGLQVSNKLRNLFIWFKFLLKHPFWYQDIIFWFYLGSCLPYFEKDSRFALLASYLILLPTWTAISFYVGSFWFIAGIGFRIISPLMFETISMKVLLPAMIVTTITHGVMLGYETIVTPEGTGAAMDDKLQQEIRERNKRLGCSIAERFTKIVLRSVAWYLLSTKGLEPSPNPGELFVMMMVVNLIYLWFSHLR